MGNILAFLFGLVSLVIVIPATIPFLGWANWFALPLIVMGVIVGQLSSSSKAGRNFLPHRAGGGGDPAESGRGNFLTSILPILL